MSLSTKNISHHAVNLMLLYILALVALKITSNVKCTENEFVEGRAPRTAPAAYTAACRSYTIPGKIQFRVRACALYWPHHTRACTRMQTREVFFVGYIYDTHINRYCTQRLFVCLFVCVFFVSVPISASVCLFGYIFGYFFG